MFVLGIAGSGLAVSGIVAAYPWFPWEQTPTLYGQVHIGAVFVTLIALSAAMVRRHHALPKRWLIVRESRNRPSANSGTVFT